VIKQAVSDFVDALGPELRRPALFPSRPMSGATGSTSPRTGDARLMWHLAFSYNGVTR